MFHAELVASTSLDKKFHTFSEQLTGLNSASVVQRNKKPKSEYAYFLSYLKAFNDPESDTSNVKSLIGMAHFMLLCAGSEIDMAEVTSSPHGLRCLSCPISRQGGVGVLFSGDGEKWTMALRNAGLGSSILQEWGRTCYQQFAKYGLDELIGRLKIKPTGPLQYYLEN